MRAKGPQRAIRGKNARTIVTDCSALRPLDQMVRWFGAPRPNALRLLDFVDLAKRMSFVDVTFVPARRSRCWALAGRWQVRPRPSPTGACNMPRYKYSERLAGAGIEPSMESVGNAYDNALAWSLQGRDPPP